METTINQDAKRFWEDNHPGQSYEEALAAGSRATARAEEIAISTATAHFAVKPKRRSLAVLLAVLLGMGTYWYTYRVDSAKLWGLQGITVGVWLTAMESHLPALMLINCGVWAYAILDAALLRPGQFYAEYPNHRS